MKFLYNFVWKINIYIFINIYIYIYKYLYIFIININARRLRCFLDIINSSTGYPIITNNLCIFWSLFRT